MLSPPGMKRQIANAAGALELLEITGVHAAISRIDLDTGHVMPLDIPPLEFGRFSSFLEL